MVVIADAAADGGIVLVQILVFVLVIMIVIKVIAAGVRQGTQGARPRRVVTSVSARSDPNWATPEPPTENGPGTFAVSGVDRESQMDVTDFIAADSPANAKVKAELRGVIVTSVTRASDPT